MPISHKTKLIKALESLDSLRSYGRLLQNTKTGASRDLFLPESDFKTCFVRNFQKKCQDFGNLETNQGHETLEFFFLCPSAYELNII